MKPNLAISAILIAIGSAVICILAQGFPLWSTGKPFPWFPQETGSIIELFGFMTGVVGVYLTVKQSIYNWPIGIINVALYGYFFLQVAVHYANAALQFIWLIYLVEGWIRWAKGGENNTELKISRINPQQAVIGGITILVAASILSPILTKMGGNVAFWDALTAAISLAAQFLLNRKVLECWLVWIAVDLIFVPLYIYRGYHATAVLYAIFLGLAINGWIQWNKSYRAQTV
jgi:nicotinamide mononucleotide transporter